MNRDASILFRWRPNRAAGAVVGAIVCMLSACDARVAAPVDAHPFGAAPRLAQDGEAVELSGELALLGDFRVGDCMAIEVDGEAVREVLILVSSGAADDSTNQNPGDVAFLAGGGPVGQVSDSPILRAGRYFLLLKYATEATPSRRARVTVSVCAAQTVPPARQLVRVAFAEGFLSEPGLWDTVDGTEDERVFLESISTLVRDEIVTALKEQFDQTPIEILDIGDEAVDPQGNREPVSVIHFLPDRVLAASQAVIDATMTPPDPARPQCQATVVFGEVLPRGTTLDVGNRVRDDEANVYVGSFQGGGADCRTAVTDSIGNIVQSLSQTAAHEIGHLAGLHHVDQIDVMNRSATVAFFRELPFGRGQLQSDRVEDGVLVSEVLTGVIQDPLVYYSSIFATPVDSQPD